MVSRWIRGSYPSNVHIPGCKRSPRNKIDQIREWRFSISHYCHSRWDALPKHAQCKRSQVKYSHLVWWTRKRSSRSRSKWREEKRRWKRWFWWFWWWFYQKLLRINITSWSDKRLVLKRGHVEVWTFGQFQILQWQSKNS